MGTHIRIEFENVSATPEDWELLTRKIEQHHRLLNGDKELIEAVVYGGYNYCGEFPNVEDVPKIKGVTWRKWYEERDADEEGALYEAEE